MPPDRIRAAIRSNVARLLREERSKRGLSLNALAQKAALSRQMIRFVEQEERNPSLDTLLRITQALEINLEDVIQQARRAANKSRIVAEPE